MPAEAVAMAVVAAKKQPKAKAVAVVPAMPSPVKARKPVQSALHAMVQTAQSAMRHRVLKATPAVATGVAVAEVSASRVRVSVPRWTLRA